MSKCLQVHSEHYMKSHIQSTLHKAEPIPGVQEMAASVDEHNECTNKYEFSTMESVQAFHLVDLQGSPFRWEVLMAYPITSWWSASPVCPPTSCHKALIFSKCQLEKLLLLWVTAQNYDDSHWGMLACPPLIGLGPSLASKACLPLDLRQYFKEWQIPQGRNSLRVER